MALPGPRGPRRSSRASPIDIGQGTLCSSTCCMRSRIGEATSPAEIFRLCHIGLTSPWPLCRAPPRSTRTSDSKGLRLASSSECARASRVTWPARIRCSLRCAGSMRPAPMESKCKDAPASASANARPRRSSTALPWAGPRSRPLPQRSQRLGARAGVGGQSRESCLRASLDTVGRVDTRPSNAP